MKNIFYGVHVVKNLFKYKLNYIKKIFFINNINKKKNILYKLSLINKLKIYFVSKNKLINLIGININHQGVAVLLSKRVFNFKIIDLFNLIEKLNRKFVFLFLDRTNNPYNLGACIRTAVAFGVNCIVITKHNTVSLENSIVHKVSSGSIYKIFILEVINLTKLISLLRKKYIFEVIGTTNDINNSISLYKFNFNNLSSLILIIGSEQDGIKNNIKKYCDYLLNIPILNINSLNLSVANGIFLYEIMRKN